MFLSMFLLLILRLQKNVYPITYRRTQSDLDPRTKTIIVPLTFPTLPDILYSYVQS